MTPPTEKSGGSRGSGRARPGSGGTPESAPPRGAPAVPGTPGWSGGPGWARGPGGQGRPGENRSGGAGTPGRPGHSHADPTADDEEVADVEIVTEDELVEHDLGQLLGTTRRERDEYLDMLRRVQADFENYKKRMLRQQTEHLERAAEALVVKLLPVLDAFDLARAHLGEGDELSPEGKALLQASSLLADTLAKEGLERIDDVGAEFDPMVHDAVEQATASEENGRGPESGPVVKDVLRSGYRWKGRVIRPAMVRVQG